MNDDTSSAVRESPTLLGLIIGFVTLGVIAFILQALDSPVLDLLPVSADGTLPLTSVAMGLVAAFAIVIGTAAWVVFVLRSGRLDDPQDAAPVD